MRPGVRVRIHCDRGQTAGDAPLVESLVSLLWREHAAVVTVVDAAGFSGASARRDPRPVTVEWDDDAAHVERVWARVAPLVADLPVTREEVVLLGEIPAALARLRLDVEVGEVMRPALPVDAALPAAEAARTLRLAGMRSAPVLGAGGALAGVVSVEALQGRGTAGEAMTAVDLSAAPDARLRDVAGGLLGRGLGEVPVIDGRRPVGMVGLLDALRLAAAPRGGGGEPPRCDEVAVPAPAATRAAASPASRVAAGAPVTAAAWRMVETGAPAVEVTEAGGGVCGVIDAAAALRALVPGL